MDFAEKKYDVFSMFNDRWALVTAGSLEDYNTMTIGWGSLGTIWGPPHKGKPIVTVYVSPARYTHSYLEENDYFTVSFFPEEYRKDLGILGSRSGRDGDKVALTALEPVAVEHGVDFRQAELTGVKFTGTDAEKAKAFIDEIRAMNKRMNIPTGFDFIKEADIPQMVTWALAEANPVYPVPVVYDRKRCEKVIRRIIAEA